MSADDAHLRRRRAVRRHESRMIDAVFHKLFLQGAAMVVLADKAREKRVAAEKREVVRDVRRAAERLLLARDVVDRHGRFGRDARDFAVVVFVEHDVACDENLAARKALLDEGEHFFDVHRKLPSNEMISLIILQPCSNIVHRARGCCRLYFHTRAEVPPHSAALP